MDRKRKLAMVFATVSVALGAGQLMESGRLGDARVAAGEAVPEGITPLSAGLTGTGTPVVADAGRAPVTSPEPAQPVAVDGPVARTAADAAPLSLAQAGTTGTVPGPVTALPDTPAAGPSDNDVLSVAAVDAGAAASATPTTASADAEKSADNVVPVQTAAPTASDDPACTLTFEASATADAMLNLTLIAPCRASERVVLRHGGLAVAYRTTVTGALFVTLPGLDRDGAVTALFADGAKAETAAPLSDLGGLRRFGVQWVAADRFEVNAFENEATFGAAGHVSARDPQRGPAGDSATQRRDTGYLTLLGDEAAVPAMMAEIYTFPTDPATKVSVDIEATVTNATCNRELLGEILDSTGGLATSTDLTLSMPDCDATGDILVLNNPLPDTTLARAD